MNEYEYNLKLEEIRSKQLEIEMLKTDINILMFELELMVSE